MGVVKNMIVRVGADLSGLISGFKKGSGATGNFAKEASAAMRSITLNQANLSKAMAQGGKNKAIVSLVDQIRELEEEQKALKAAGFSWGYEGFEGNEALLRSLKAELTEYIRAQEEAGDVAEQTARKAGRLGSAVRSAGGWLKQGAKNLLSIGASAKASGPGVEGLLRSIRRLGIVSLGLRLSNAIFGELGSIVRQHISEHAQLQAQVEALKSSFGQALAPAINIVTNALSALMPYIVGVSNAIGSLISNLAGAGWSSVATDANAAAKAIGGAGGAQKDFNRSLQGFDEITKLDSKSSGGGGGGGSSNAAATDSIEGKTPAWLDRLTERIEQAVREKDWRGVGSALADSLNSGIASVNDMDVSIGSKIAEWINNSVAVATGLVEDTDWKLLGETVWTNVKDLFVGLFPNADPKTHGGMSGGMLRWTVSIDADGSGAEGFLNYFKGYIRKAQDEYPEIGEDIGLGIIMGICDAFKNAGDWIVEHLWTPLKEGFQETFDGSIWGKLFGGNDSKSKAEVDVQANVTSIKDKVRNKTIDGGRMNIFDWFDRIRNKTVEQGKMSVTSVQDNVSNKTLQNGKLWINSIVDNIVNKTIDNGVVWVDSWKDHIDNSNKWLALKALVEQGWNGSLEEAMGIAVLHSKLVVNTPTVKVKWKQSYAEQGNPNSAHADIPVYNVQYNARGSIFNAASLLGRVGDSWQVGGEAGREALLPLDRHTWWMNDIADRVVSRLPGGYSGGEQTITVNLIVDGKVLASTVVRHVNAQARATGVNPLAAYI